MEIQDYLVENHDIDSNFGEVLWSLGIINWDERPNSKGLSVISDPFYVTDEQLLENIKELYDRKEDKRRII